ncbi:MAG TPA: dihydroorotate dehydrogenase-like protein [Spirochaetia bacterium]|nr:dihydroorotate dehydrogenase-like protein [Spirochaetia bacterium]
MANLNTTYMGLELKNPLVVSSSGLTNTIQGIERSFHAGAGAVVLKSLFEEQIDYELQDQKESDDLSIHPEAGDYLERMGKELGPSDYLSLIKAAKKQFGEPLIASVNCVSSKWWADWARQIEDAGADALELNIAIMPRGSAQVASEIEDLFLAIVDRVKRGVSIPIAVKLGPYFTALPQLIERLRRSGVKGLVLFNRFYQLDIDVKAMRLVPAYQFSSAGEIYPTIRWTSILSGQCGCDIAASTGVGSGEDVVKLLLAGAQAVQLCSTLYRNGYEHLTTLLSELESWMRGAGFGSVEEFRGKLSQEASSRPEGYERLQYIKALTGIA